VSGGVRALVRQLEATLVEEPAPGAFSDAELLGLPEPVQRHLRAVIAPGTPLARSARLEMRGQIKIGCWVPFRAHETLTPRRGFVWQARAAGLIVGYDHYVDGPGGMDWKLAGLVRVAHADGPDVSRAAAERAGGEAFWLPTSLLPRFDVECFARDDANITAHRTFDGMTIPSAGTFGWFYGTNRWSEGEFFRYEITALEIRR
jgi:hypothetical protein